MKIPNELLNLYKFEPMLKEREDQYIKWLKAIANTRLMFNTLEELQEFMGNNSISSNGIKKVCKTPQKLRAAFRDLKVESSLMTDNNIELEQLLDDYEKASKFFNLHLSRRKDADNTARLLMNYYYAPQGQKQQVPSRLSPIFEKVLEEGIDVDILVLRLLGAIPGYSSKGGDVEDIDIQWRKVMGFIDDFTHGCGDVFQSIPAIAKAKDEPNKCRLMLIHHTQGLMGIYSSYAESSELRDTSVRLKESRVPLVMAGFWNECDGKADQTDFWQIEDSVEEGVFFATWWHKSGDELKGVKYTMSLTKSDDGKLVAFFIDPEAIRHRIEGKQYQDQDHGWYVAELPETLTPDKLVLERDLPSKKWRSLIHLTRVKERSTLELYQKWLDKCRINISHKTCQYVFEPRLWATTFEASYIIDDLDEELIYMVPRQCDERFEDISLGDNVGILTMDGKRYLAFDESLLYIPLEDEELQKYGIRKITLAEMV